MFTTPADWNSHESGIDRQALVRYVEEQIYTLPGVSNHRNLLTVLLTGSRAMGTFMPDSDVDIDVLCPERVYPQLQRACREAGITGSRKAMWCPLSRKDDDWRRYFGGDSVPHFCVNTLESVRKQVRSYEDVPLWIWTNSKVIADPGDQFRSLFDGVTGYPRDVLVRKIKHRWLSVWYWGIEVYPFHHRNDDQLIVATAAVVNAILDLMRVWYLVDGKPYPYTEKLPDFVGGTTLGAEFAPVVHRWLEIVVGKADGRLSAWERLDKASGLLLDDTGNPETVAIEEETTAAIITAGVGKEWMDDYFSNMDELLLGELGPPP